MSNIKQMSNVKYQTNFKCQMSIRFTPLSERTSGVSPVIFTNDDISDPDTENMLVFKSIQVHGESLSGVKFQCL